MARNVFDPRYNIPFNVDGSDPSGLNQHGAPAPVDPTAAPEAPLPPVDPTASGGTGTGSISLTTAGTASAQNFDTLVNTGTSTTLPTGWYIQETGTAAAANGSYTAGTGSSNTGDTYSFGAAASTDRALGSLLSSTNVEMYGAQFTNNTGGAIGSLAIAYTGEQWRLGATGRNDRLDFQISFDATSLTTGTWTDVNQLDFIAPNATGTVGALDGNAAANQVAVSYTLALANAIASGATFWIRYVDSDASGSDDGLGIDNFSLTPIAAVVSAPGSLTIADMTVAEGNSGDTDMVFTVTRAGGSAGAISATYTITNGTTDASDFGTGFVSTGTVTFADGATTAQIHVPIAGDATYEPNETFSVALSAPTGGATLGAHATAIGTITNDDAAPAGTLSIGDVTVAEGDSGDTDAVFTVTRANGSVGAVSATYTIANGTTNASDFGTGFVTTGTVTFADGATTAQIHVPIHGDTTYEPNETFTVTLSAPTGGASLGTATGTGTITNDDPIPPPANVYINEIHYDNAGTDAGEAIEIAGVAGTDLSNYKLVFYNGSNTPGAAPVYMTTNLTGVIDNEGGSGYGALSFSYPSNGIQNGIADGVALIAPDGTVIQLLSWEGVFTAAAGTPAAGVTSTDIGVSEDGSGALGQSLQLTGSGASYADFTWQPDSTSSFGSLNTNQIIIADNATGQIRVADASVVEGNSGTSNLTFTVYRAGGLGSSATVDYTINLDGTATSDDIGAGAVLTGTVTFAVGAHSATVTVPVVGDTVGEGNETLSLTLSNPTGNIAITDANAVGTIVNDDFVTLTISQIQGAGHTSAYVGQPVQTTGIVTAVDTNGFYLQSAIGDGNAATSDAIFVFTSTAPTVVVGDGVTVGGTVTEYAGDAQALTLTEINSPTVTVDSHNNPLPAAILIGTGGILPPSQNLDDDHLTVYDPVHDGLDFWESLEGMRVTIDTPQAVSNTTSLGETFVIASHGVGATGVNDRGGITISPNGDGTVDYNPEMIQIDDDSGVFAGFNPNYSVGDQLSSVTGIVNYSFDNYEVVVTEAVTVTRDVTLTRETTTLQGNSDYLSLGTYNLENLDASDNKYTILASDIVYNLRAPDILAVQEVQDADGAGSGTNLSGVGNAQGIIDAIFALTGKHYGYIEIAPTVANTTGGEPNGNIRNGYFYNMDRVTYVANSAELITGSAYNGSRNPLVATWLFNGQSITTIDVHSTSRGGSEPLRGNDQPAAAAGDAQRTAQAAGVNAYVNAHLADNPNLNIAVLGDWNGFYFEPAQTQLTVPAQGGQLTNVNYLLAPEERYSYLFDGNAQQIDNILVSQHLLAAATNYDAVHLNSQFGGSRPTDHDPQVVVFKLGNSGGDSFFGTSGNDTYTIDNVNDHVYENANGGTDTILSSISYDLANAPNVENLTLTGTANLEAYGDANTNVLTGNAGDNFLSDGGGGADTLIGGAGWDNYSISSANVTIVENPGEGLDVIKTTVSFSIANLPDVEGLRLAPGSAGTDLTGNANANKLVGNANDNMLDGGGGGDTLRGGLGNDTYIVRDASDRIVEAGGEGSDTVQAAVSYSLTTDAFVETLRTIDASATTAINLTGNDYTVVIQGNAGANVLTGGAGNETISGFGGNDTLFGGGGNDVFAFAVGTGQDSVGDFVSGSDKLDLSAFFSDFSQVQAATHDVGGNAVIDLGGGNSVTLSGFLTAQLQSSDIIYGISFAAATPADGGAHNAVVSRTLIDLHDVVAHQPSIADLWFMAPTTFPMLA